MGRVEGKVALITGAASGLGAEDARLLAREGARVVITDVQDEMGKKVAAEIPGALYLHQDVRNEVRWTQVVAETIAHFGKLDILVNNAGIVRVATIEDMRYEDYKFQIDVMLDGTFLGCKAAIPYMTKGGGGAIINMASIGGIKGISVLPGYAAAKGGVIAMTRSIAVHCQEQRYSIRVNAIAPGGIATPMVTQFAADTAGHTAALEQSREHGLGSPEDVANLVLFLASDESRHVTGTTIVIDNGETAK